MQQQPPKRPHSQGHAPNKAVPASRSLASSVGTATAGPVGAAFQVVHRDWTCGACGADNSGRYRKCARCREGLRGEEAIVWHDGAVTAAMGGEGHGWREALDPETHQIYYCHTKTGETTWERPAVMGPAPLNTGWFGRGSAQVGGQSKYDRLDAEYRSRPAPRQAEPPSADASANAPLEGAGEFNIWFGRFQGQHWAKQNGKGDKAESRCVVKDHAGYTKAAPEAFFCLWFSRGACHRGASCRFHHRVPTVLDCGRLEKDPTKDVFGRPRKTVAVDDQGGVSCVHDASRTLYVGGLVRAPYEHDHDALRECVERHFSEWGEIESVNVVWRLSVAFVRYRFRSNTEMAVEALANQSLDNEEVMTLKWAREDPNPVAKEAAARANADAVVAAVAAVENAALRPPPPRAAPDHLEDAPQVKRLMAGPSAVDS
jgi:hypothetical protein